MKRPIIGITTGIIKYRGDIILAKDRLYVSKDYSDVLNDLGAIPVLIPILEGKTHADYYTDLCDGFIFTAGDDISPLVYGENPHEKLSFTNRLVDEVELELMSKVIEKDKPLLGICRGAQLLNICRGGNLYQDIPSKKGLKYNHLQKSEGYDPSHVINIEEGNILYELLGEMVYVNSYHHQSVNCLGEGIEVLARAEDGIVEAIELVDKDFILGVQWHPEMMVKKSDEMLPIFEELLRRTKK